MFSVIELTLILQQIKAPLQRLLDHFNLTLTLTKSRLTDKCTLHELLYCQHQRKYFNEKKTQIVQCLAIIMVIFQRIKRPLQRLLDHAKANIDVIDFRNPQKEVR